MEWITAYIAVGSNVGDRAGTIGTALRLLEHESCRVVRVSSLMGNPAVGMPEGSGAFLNGAAELRTSLLPRELLDRLLGVEQQLGRVRGAGWSPRTIDLDLLLYGTQEICESGLIVPHPRMLKRDFVMMPLVEIAGEMIHPTLQMMLRDLVC